MDNMKSYKNNIKIKVFSVVFAFFMWLYVMAEVDPIIIKTVENIPITTIANIEEISNSGFTFSYGQSFSVKIDLRGKRSALNELVNSGVTPIGYIENPQIGKNVMNLTFDVPREIEYSISPESLIVDIEKSVIALKPVKIETTEIKTPNYVVADIVNSKNQIYVEGPQSQVNKVDNLRGIVEIGDNTKTFTSQVKLMPVDSKGNKVEGLTVSNPSIVSEVAMEKIALVPVDIILEDEEGNKSKSDSLIIQGNQVKIQGEEKLIDSTKVLKTKPMNINTFNNLENKIFELEPIVGIKYEKPTVQVDFVEAEMQAYTVSINKGNFIFLGEADADKIKEALPEEVTIEVRAGKQYDPIANVENVKVYIENVLKSNTGEYSFSARINFPYSDIKINPSSVKIQA